MFSLATALTVASSLIAAASAGEAGTFATSNVAGRAFDRFIIIYFENQNYDLAYGDGKAG